MRPATEIFAVRWTPGMGALRGSVCSWLRLLQSPRAAGDPPRTNRAGQVIGVDENPLMRLAVRISAIPHEGAPEG